MSGWVIGRPSTPMTVSSPTSASPSSRSTGAGNHPIRLPPSSTQTEQRLGTLDVRNGPERPVGGDGLLEQPTPFGLLTHRCQGLLGQRRLEDVWEALERSESPGQRRPCRG